MNKSKIKLMVTSGMIQAAETLMMAQALVMMLRPIVEAYEREILIRYQFNNFGEKSSLMMVNEKRLLKGMGPFEYVEEVILDPKQTYRLNEIDAAIFESERQVACAASGLKVEDPEYCPLLVAENLENQAQRVFVDSMKPITTFDYDQILQSSDCLNKIKQAVNLELGLLFSLGVVKKNASDLLLRVQVK